MFCGVEVKRPGWLMGSSLRIDPVLMPSDVLKLEGHMRFVNKFVVLSDNQRIASASNDSTVRLFCVLTGQLLSTLRHNGRCKDVAVIDEQTIVSVTDHGHACFWRVSDATLLCIKEIRKIAGIACAVLNTKQVIVGLEDGEFVELLWDGKVASTQRTIRLSHDAIITGIVANSTKFAIAILRPNSPLGLWDSATFECLVKRSSRCKNVTCVAINDRYIVAGLMSGKLHVFRESTLRLLNCIKAHKNRVNSVQLVGSHCAVLSCSVDETVAIHDIRSQSCLWRIRVGFWVSSAAIVQHNRVIVVNARGHNLLVFTLPNSHAAIPARSSPLFSQGAFQHDIRQTSR